MKYDITSEITLKCRVEIEASSEDEAREIAEGLTCFEMSEDKGVSIRELGTISIEVEKINNMAQDVWQKTSKLDRMLRLVKNGWDDEKAYIDAGLTIAPTIAQEYFVS